MTRNGIGVWLALGAFAGIVLGLTAYECIAFGWHPAREEVPGTSGWYWLRGVLTAFASLGLVGAIAAQTPVNRGPLVPKSIGLVWLTLMLALATCALMVLNPSAYQRIGAEDGVTEWLSALLLFVAAGCFAARLWRSRRNRWPDRIIAGGFATLFFVMAMEEVSWFQRVIGFATPERVAARNWQGEFNFHNFHTDLTELALYTGTGVFLMLLPLVREHLARWRVVAPIADWLPDRTVAAFSAPMLAFTYSHWNLLPVQAVFWIGVGGCAIFALSARASGRGREAALFAALVLVAACGQWLHLAFGHRMMAIFDASEYRELFFAIGLAAFAWRQRRPRLTDA